MIDKSGIISTIPAEKIKFEYRNNNLSDDLIFLSASFKGQKKNQKKIEKEMIRMKNQKENKTEKTHLSGRERGGSRCVRIAIRPDLPAQTLRGGSHR